jgi:hypothetical protein
MGALARIAGVDRGSCRDRCIRRPVAAKIKIKKMIPNGSGCHWRANQLRLAARTEPGA